MVPELFWVQKIDGPKIQHWNLKICSDVNSRVGTPHMKMCSDVLTRVGTPQMFRTEKHTSSAVPHSEIQVELD